MRIFTLVLIALVSCVSCNSGPSPVEQTDDVSLDTPEMIDASVDVNADTEPKIDASETDTSNNVNELPNTISIATNVDPVEATIEDLRTEIELSPVNALPFFTASYHGTGAVLENVHVDVSLLETSVVLSRRVAPLVEDEFVSLHGDVVSFDPNFLEVTCEPFSTAFEIGRAPFPPADNTTRFFLFWYEMKTGTNNKSAAAFSGFFDDTRDEVRLERFHPAGGAYGRICVANSKNETFSVQHVEAEIGIGESTVMLPIEAVDPEKSIVFVSHQASKHQSRPGHSQVACDLLGDHVRCERGLIEDTIPFLRAQVVTFQSDTVVERLAVTIPDGETEVRIDDVTPGTIIFGPTGVIGEVATTADEKPNVPGSYVEAWFEETTLVFRRGAPQIGEITIYPQIVRW